jgi:quinoprotein glucose dehydrogenase
LPVDTTFVHYTSPIDFMLQSNGLSAIGPPWSQLTAYDLNTGAIKWQVPHGGVAALVKQGHPETGAHFPRGGIVVTGSGLIFAATASDLKIRAYDEDTGKVLWERALPSGSEGIPAIYEVGGREYLAVCVAAGSGMMAAEVNRDSRASPPAAGAYMTFALPKR